MPNPTSSLPEGEHTPSKGERRGFCEHFIEHPSDPWGGCYCKLLAGHEGEHSAHYPPDPRGEQIQ